MITDEADIKIEIRRFLRSISDHASAVVVFAELDALLELDPGSAKTYLANLAREANFTVEAEGTTRVELKGPPIEPPTMFTIARA